MKYRVDWEGGLVAVTLFLCIWTGLAMLINRPIVPPPWEVIPVFAREMGGELGKHMLVSAGRVLSAIALAVITAAPAGLILGQSETLNRFLFPLIALVHPIPKIVFLPVILILLGSGDLSKVTLIAMILFFQILVVVRDEAAGLRPELIMSVRSLGAGRRALFRYVYLPASLPAVLTALRVSVGTAVAVLFITETYATRSGLGYYIVVETWQVLRYREMYAGILAMSLLGLGLYSVIGLLERRVARWKAAK